MHTPLRATPPAGYGVGPDSGTKVSTSSAVKEPEIRIGSSAVPEDVMMSLRPLASTDPETFPSLDSESVTVPLSMM